jgi:Tol biopolymer transport system component
VNQDLYVVPFDLTALGEARSQSQLKDMNGCFTYGLLANQPPVKSVRWSNDGKKLAVVTISVESGRLLEQVRLFDISACDSSAPYALDIFPAARFTMINYNSRPVIPSFDWDGYTLFVLNSLYRFELGYLYEYNSERRSGKNLDPLGTACCYSEPRFSPDGSSLLFAYQNIKEGENARTQLYYVSYGSIGTGVSYTPIPLPEGFFSSPGDHLDAALRPVKP